MSEPPIRTVGHLTVDDVVLPDGSTRMHQVGGASVFAAAGARLAGRASEVVTALAPNLPAEVTSWLERERLPVLPCGHTERYISQWVLYEHNGKRTFLLHPDSAGLDEAAPDPRAWTVRPGGWAHIAPMPVPLQQEWVRTLTAQGVRVTLDPHEDAAAEDPGGILELLPALEAFLPSELEAAGLYGGADMDAAARFFLAAGARLCVIKLGPAGCIVATQAGIWRVPAIAAECVDVTGAGDTFCGGFVAALASGADPEDAARCGTVAASYAIEDFGVPSAGSGAPADWGRRMARAKPERIAA